MSANIPLYPLHALSETGGNGDVLFLDGASPRSGVNIRVPYRSDYYKVGLCTRGTATLQVGPARYSVVPGTLIVIPPGIIKQWPELSADFEALSVFFTKAFLVSGSAAGPDVFPFFDAAASHAFQLSGEEVATIHAALVLVGEKFAAAHPYRGELLKSHITGMLYEIAAVCDAHSSVQTGISTRGQQLSAAFRRLVLNGASTERSLKFYAEQLCITPKHLTETVKATTGKTAGDWITESAILEAKVLLQDPALSVAEIAEQLNFSDQAAFSKFFKRNAGLSPMAYKKNAV